MEILSTCLVLAGQSHFVTLKSNGVSFRWQITADTKRCVGIQELDPELYISSVNPVGYAEG